MLAFLYTHLDHVLALLLLISRLGDIGSTYLVTPNLQLEANPIVRRLGWRFAIATLAFCLLPYLSVELGVMAVIPFLMVSAANASRVWVARTLGEAEYRALMIRVARRSRRSHALAAVCASAAFIALTGLVVLLFYPDPAEDWGFWMALGFFVYAFAIALYGCLATLRLFHDAAGEDVEESSDGKQP